MKHYVYPVRWIGTNYPGANTNYQHISRHRYESLKASLYWELFVCTRQRAFAYSNRNANVGESWCGLLVDITRSDIDVISKGDCYSLRDEASQQLLGRRFISYKYHYAERDSNGEQTVKH